MKYMVSDNYEINIVDDRYIYIDTNFAVVYVVDDLAFGMRGERKR